MSLAIRRITQKIPYPQIIPRGRNIPTSILSSDFRRIVPRSFRDSRVSDKFLSSFSQKVEKFAKDIKLAFTPHNRGDFAYFNFGIQHGSGNGNKVLLSHSLRISDGLSESSFLRNHTGSRCIGVIKKPPRFFCRQQKFRSSCEYR